MMKRNRANFLYWLGIITAIWFTLTGSIWVYGGALFIAYPIGLISLTIWYILRKNNEKRNRNIIRILAVGLIISVSFLLGLLLTN